MKKQKLSRKYKKRLNRIRKLLGMDLPAFKHYVNVLCAQGYNGKAMEAMLENSLRMKIVNGYSVLTDHDFISVLEQKNTLRKMLLALVEYDPVQYKSIFFFYWRKI